MTLNVKRFLILSKNMNVSLHMVNRVIIIISSKTNTVLANTHTSVCV